MEQNQELKCIYFGHDSVQISKINKDTFEDKVDLKNEIYDMSIYKQQILVSQGRNLVYLPNRRILAASQIKNVPIILDNESITSVKIVNNKQNEDLSIVEFIFGTNQGNVYEAKYQLLNEEYQQNKLYDCGQSIQQLQMIKPDNNKYLFILTSEHLLQLVKIQDQQNSIIYKTQLSQDKSIEGVYQDLIQNFDSQKDGIIYIQNQCIKGVDFNGDVTINIQLDKNNNSKNIRIFQYNGTQIICLLSENKIQLFVLNIFDTDNQLIQIFENQIEDSQKYKYIDQCIMIDDDNLQIAIEILNSDDLVKTIEMVNVNIQQLLQQKENISSPIQKQVNTLDNVITQKQQSIVQSKVQEQESQNQEVVTLTEEQLSLKQEQQDVDDVDIVMDDQNIALLPHQIYQNKIQEQEYKYQIPSSLILQYSEQNGDQQLQYNTQQELQKILQTAIKYVYQYNTGKISINGLKATFELQSVNTPYIHTSQTGTILSADIKNDCYCMLTSKQLNVYKRVDNERVVQQFEIKYNQYDQVIQVALGNSTTAAVLSIDGQVTVYESGIKIFSSYCNGRMIAMYEKLLAIATDNEIIIYDVYTPNVLFKGILPLDQYFSFLSFDNNCNLYIGNNQYTFISRYLNNISSEQITWELILDQKQQNLKKLLQITNEKQVSADKLQVVYNQIVMCQSNNMKIQLFGYRVTDYLLFDIKDTKIDAQKLQNEITKVQEEDLDNLVFTPEYINATQDIQLFEQQEDLAQQFYQAQILLGNKKCLSVCENNELKTFDSIAIKYMLQLINNQNMAGARIPISRLQLKQSLDIVRNNLQELNQNDLIQYVYELYNTYYDDEDDEIGTLQDADMLPTGLGRMYAQEGEDQNMQLAPKYQKRITDISDCFNTGGRLSLQHFQKGCQLQIDSFVKKSEERIQLLTSKKSLSLSGSRVSPQQQKAKENVMSTPVINDFYEQKQLPDAPKNGNALFLQKLNNKKATPTVLQPNNQVASPTVVTKRNLFGTK